MLSTDPLGFLLPIALALSILHLLCPRVFNCLFISLGLLIAKADDTTTKDVCR
ncbi:hypothetical protein AUEXF2481DRAFT_39215 [Aureobasidium subglaciale EXF-2481]|uniref:Uncharacterized protein n=1 Tax=Aureobasidium subglaciale (strain EXF-2481) TaxID=1043005 RepID=A0A074YQ21_AURSE|nr:uncharacterized protein AUEXF2481DRAFT_39215 [Aureobasidium subglaciale EXF-2481]KEQ96132.1 hypothetical protein AUEXF2481DRAFT_39215 [Aureobasidium subglaciale EXF-2481]